LPRKIEMSIIVEISKEFRFEAAHYLPNVSKNHQCHKIHGHSYLVTLRAQGPIDPTIGWVMDLTELSLRFAPILRLLDHSLLNEIKGLDNPTSENLAVWIMCQLGKNMPELNSVTVEATNRISVTVRRKNVLSLLEP
jgi:6-pyruvoyltetrahydropterin/6-carboxytetrahydropterin synthase